MPIFERSLPTAQTVEGMMSDFSMRVMDAILDFQAESLPLGHLLEFGVFKGRSAVIIASQARAGERVILVDVERYISDQTLQLLPAAAEFVLGRSEEFATSFAEFERIAGGVRFLHVDSSHAYRTTLAEMALAERLLAPHGVLCLDDYSNLNYSQILPAVYKYLFTQPTDLTVFLVTNEKCYLCRRQHFALYADFTLRRLHGAMQARGADRITLARTDVDVEYSAFYLRESLSPDEGRCYGESIYGHLYKDAAPIDMSHRPLATAPAGAPASSGWIRRLLR